MKRKVTAFILRKNPSTTELLLHSFVDDPSLPLRLPGGGVEPGETIEQALHREVQEETGLTGLQLVRNLGVQSYFKPYIQANVERHDFLLSAPNQVLDTWDFQVQGKGGDAEDIFRFHWLNAQNLASIDEEHAQFITPSYIPELFDDS